MSYDIEADSSHGDFPLPIKDYTKLGREIYSTYTKLQFNDRKYDQQKYKYEMVFDCLRAAFKDGDDQLGISKVYLSKINQIDKFKSEYRKLWCIHDNDNDEFLNWYDSHGTEKCYLLCKAGLDKASQLQMSNEKVSRRNLKEYIEQKPKDKKEETLSLPNDEYLIAMVK